MSIRPIQAGLIAAVAVTSTVAFTSTAQAADPPPPAPTPVHADCELSFVEQRAARQLVRSTEALIDISDRVLAGDVGASTTTESQESSVLNYFDDWKASADVCTLALQVVSREYGEVFAALARYLECYFSFTEQGCDAEWSNLEAEVRELDAAQHNAEIACDDFFLFT